MFRVVVVGSTNIGVLPQWYGEYTARVRGAHHDGIANGQVGVIKHQMHTATQGQPRRLGSLQIAHLIHPGSRRVHHSPRCNGHLAILTGQSRCSINDKRLLLPNLGGLKIGHDCRTMINRRAHRRHCESRVIGQEFRVDHRAVQPRTFDHRLFFSELCFGPDLVVIGSLNAAQALIGPQRRAEHQFAAHATRGDHIRGFLRQMGCYSMQGGALRSRLLHDSHISCNQIT